MNLRVKTKDGRTLVFQHIDAEYNAFMIEARKAYYEGDPIINDDVYDMLEYHMQKNDPTNPILTMVGYTETMFRQNVKHDVPMRSMQKGHTLDDIKTWAKNVFGAQIDFVVQPKIDGLSMTVRYENGRMQLAATRGKDQVGKDVTDRVRYIPAVPLSISIKEKVEIRGEVYLAKNNKFSKPGEPLRNLAAGLIGRKDGAEDCKYLSFVAYEMVGRNFKTVEDKLNFLKKLGFESFSPFFVSTVDDLQSVYDKYLTEHRNDWQFESDGLVVQPNDTDVSDSAEDNNAHHPRWAIAWKPPAEEKISEALTGIDARVTRLGYIVPTGVFEPVTIMGTTIRRATLFHFANVKTMMLNRGDPVKIKRSGDVIPQIVANMAKDKKPSLLIPDVCPACGHKTVETDVHLLCPNAKCEGKQLDKIVYWVTKCEMDQISDSTIQLLFDNDIVKSIGDLYSLKAKDMADTKGLGEKKIANLLEQIDKTRTMNVVEFLNRLGIPLVGTKALNKLGIKSLDDFRKFRDDEYAIGRSIIEWRREPGNMALVDELTEYIDIKAYVPRTGKKICFTGSGPLKRGELISIAEKLGYVFADSVNKELDLLVCDDVNGASSKLQKARKLGVGIMSYTEFLK